MQKKKAVHTGIPGLDDILYGGVPPGAVVILEGEPGTGKTTFGMQFLVEGAIKHDEPGIYITFEELPEQIYDDMTSFGWDLRDLERQNKLRVICMEPDILLEQMLQPHGLFEQIVREIGCKRVVIDSISLFRMVGDEEHVRTNVYSIRNIMRKHSLTSFFIREYSEFEGMSMPFENYICDGIVRLSLKPLMDKYRKRTIEVLKMRGTRILEGEHTYKFIHNGVYIVPSLSMAEDKMLIREAEVLSTGIDSLDDLLAGGIPRGSVFMIDTNSKANYRYLLSSIYSQRIKDDDCTVTMMSGNTSLDTFADTIELFGVSLREAARKGKAFFIEHYRRAVEADLEKAIVRVDKVTNEEYAQVLNERLNPIFECEDLCDKRWFVYYDLNTIISERGKDFLLRYFAEEMSMWRSLGITIVVHCNFAEIGTETASFLERTCNGVIRTWVDGNYQYLQVTKSPSGRVSAPHIIANVAEKPFVQLI
ncbi:ATPase domain-containing protein [Paenibacillus shenyangensis]|uniref:ATPase domain-containing protein n=1 Tax=Paenibacillus sp. A9 TaxID=1284352 RepID=UPI00037CC472|nr:ATPase domain-containing protein [Paenibacillus sp. A9]